jgi:hypothetical protein
MNEQCAGCPWLDEPKKQCRRTPPRFCSVDETVKAKPAIGHEDESQAKIYRVA